MKTIYTPQVDGDNMIYINGPAPGGQCSYYGGFLNPESRYATDVEAKKVAILMNMAYQEGYKKAQYNIQTALGV